MYDHIVNKPPERKRETANTEDLIWYKIVSKNPKRRLLEIPNELFLLLGIFGTILLLAFGILKFLGSKEIDFSSFKMTILFAFCWSLFCILLAMGHRYFLHRHMSSLEKKYLAALNEIKTIPEKYEEETTPSIPVYFPELDLHFQKLVDGIARMTEKIDNLPSNFAEQNYSELGKHLDDFSERILKLPNALDEILGKHQVDMNQEKTDFRHAVAILANWTPEFEEIKNELKNVSKNISKSESSFEKSITAKLDEFNSSIERSIHNHNSVSETLTTKTKELIKELTAVLSSSESNLKILIDISSTIKSVFEERSTAKMTENLIIALDKSAVNESLTRLNKNVIELKKIVELSQKSISSIQTGHIQTGQRKISTSNSTVQNKLDQPQIDSAKANNDIKNSTSKGSNRKHKKGFLSKFRWR